MRDKLIIVLAICLFLAMVISAVALEGEMYFDGCNWCVKNGDMTSCTTLMCKDTLKGFREIPNPYKEGVCEKICEEGYGPNSLSADCKCILIPK